ncbi:MAG: DUF2461 domain-containing protein [Cyclobacteriaceae bacterium]|nr:DUF2461 domain-containing protein [Cyclobacteriaceae bacterium]
MDYNLTNTFDFLNRLAKNNNREWFAEHKSEYLEVYDSMIGFANTLLSEMQKHDHIETASGKKSLYRIYRDIRFSKDKTPYKNNLGGSFRRSTSLLRGGYYYHIQPRNSFVAGGFWGPNKEDLLHIRKHIALEAQPLRDVLNSTSFKENFGTLLGEQLKTAPKGFDKDHEAIDLLRYKQFVIRHSFTDKEVLAPNFHLEMAEMFKQMRPFFDYMSEILTTDLNGTPLEG